MLSALYFEVQQYLSASRYIVQDCVHVLTIIRYEITARLVSLTFIATNIFQWNVNCAGENATIG